MITRVDPQRCTGCGTCQEVCPLDVLRLDGKEKKAVIRYPEDCQTCFVCELECPAGAITVGPFRKERPRIMD
ncbi:MAG: ferredoxin family protein [Actinobacteria bacterium]|nr:MAG: ferredoxin family protein [Actinomycetota bacterium]